MPIYTYRCDCGAERELFRTMSNRNGWVGCKSCASDTSMRLVIEAPAVRVSENIFDRVNKNWEKRREKKAKGELLQ